MIVIPRSTDARAYGILVILMIAVVTFIVLRIHLWWVHRKNAKNLQAFRGKYLDRFGEVVGLTRIPGEHDDAFRKRCEEEMTAKNYSVRS